MFDNAASVPSVERVCSVFDDAIYSIERVLADEGLFLDTETDDALAVIKYKLSNQKDAL
jgi:hypothetical protein